MLKLVFVVCYMLSVADGVVVPEVDCGTVACPAIACPNQIPPAEGECCSTCPEPGEGGVRCNLIQCSPPKCQKPVPPSGGECCPRCPEEPVECSKESCGVDLCPNPRPAGPGQCCPFCDDCRVVRCQAPPPCPDGRLVFPPGKCCQRCQRRNLPCMFDGKSHPDGSTFWNECNKCTCNNGNAACNLMACAPGCYKNGQRYDAQASVPGSNPCETCNCNLLDGKYSISCSVTVCATPTCANPETPPGKCCPVCEGSGRPCVVNGINHPDGSTFWEECNQCTCSNGNAACTLMACAPGCYKDGTRYDAQASVPSNIPCETCTCNLFDGRYRISCAIPACAEPPCSNPVTPPGKCCPVCEGRGRPCVENGVNHPDGSTFWKECNKCTCSNGNAACTLMGCAPGCYKDGTRYDELATIPGTGPCLSCTCRLLNGKYSIPCEIINCPRLPCAEPVPVPGQCCPVCEGTNAPCVVNGKSYADGSTFWKKCNQCTCSNGNAGCTLKACAPGCYNEGTRYGDQASVPNKDPCKTCTCNLSNGKYSISCVTKTCPEPSCANPVAVPGKCCPECGGSNLPCVVGGKSYPDGTTFWDECNTCTCSNGNAGCTLMACAPGCYRKGKRYDASAIVPNNDPCKTCTCNLSNGKYSISCGTQTCPEPTCANPVSVPGVCCPGCEGSSLPCVVDGTSHPDGLTFWNKCNRCTCTNGKAGCTKKACAPGCYKDGQHYDARATVPGNNPCEICTCNLFKGKYSTICTVLDCAKPPCANPVSVPGKCCPVCEVYPSENRLPCKVGGSTYQHGETFWNKCNRCTCMNGNAACTIKACANGCYADGTRYDAGDVVITIDPCETCRCMVSGTKYTIECNREICLKPDCPNPIKPPGKCCQVCTVTGKSCTVNGKTYNDGETYMDDCNKCRCSNGASLCTKMACVPKCQDGSLPHAIVTCGGISGSVCPTGFHCENANPPPGSADVAGQCCKDSGQSCTVNGKTYKDGESFMDDCNSCRCINGAAACTKMACAPRKECNVNGKVYPDGASFKDDCNDCRCSDGNAACTKKACAPRKECNVNGKVYPDGASFKDDCNDCRCSDGNVGCTKKACAPKCIDGTAPLPAKSCGGIVGLKCPRGFYCDNSNAPPNSADFPGVCCKGSRMPCKVNGKIYQSGTSFMNDCNRCRCNNGKAGCTKKACPPKCSDGSKPLPNRSCGGVEGGEMCPDRFVCQTSSNAAVSGICCRRPRNCAGVKCPPTTCAEPSTPDGACCPECPAACNLGECPELTCPVSYTPQGECCPVCKDCTQVVCPPLPCRKPIQVPGECCMRCRRNNKPKRS